MYSFVILTALNFALKTLIANVETNIAEYFVFFATLSLINEFVEYVMSVVSNAYSTQSMIKYNKDCLDKYASMTRVSKEKVTIEVFDEKVRRASTAIKSEYTWGASVVTSLISSICGFFIIIVTYKQYKILIMFVCIHVCWYWAITKNMISEMDTKRTLLRSDRGTIIDLLNLLKTRLHNDQCTVSEVIKKKLDLENMNKTIDNYWSLVMASQRLPNFVIMFFVGLTVEKSC